MRDGIDRRVGQRKVGSMAMSLMIDLSPSPYIPLTSPVYTNNAHRT